MVTCHCKTLESSTKPAEKPSIGFRVKSVFIFRIHSSSSSSSNQKRKRKKSVQNVGVASSLSSFNHHHRPHHNHHHHHHHRRERERERERDKKTKQKKDEKNDAPLSWFLNKSTAWSVILFSSLFSRVFLLKWFILYHTRKQRGEIQHQLLRRR